MFSLSRNNGHRSALSGGHFEGHFSALVGLIAAHHLPTLRRSTSLLRDLYASSSRERAAASRIKLKGVNAILHFLLNPCQRLFPAGRALGPRPPCCRVDPPCILGLVGGIPATNGHSNLRASVNFVLDSRSEVRVRKATRRTAHEPRIRYNSGPRAR